MKKAGKILYNVFFYLVISIMAIVLLITAYLSFAKIVLKKDIPTIFGIGGAVIVSYSMEPEIKKDDIVIIKKQDTYELEDVITFKDEIGALTHRIVEVTENGYVTRGDANNSNDNEISKEDVFGKVVYVVHGGGLVIEYFKQPLNLIMLLLFIVLVFVTIFFIKNALKNKE